MVFKHQNQFQINDIFKRRFDFDWNKWGHASISPGLLNRDSTQIQGKFTRGELCKSLK